MELDVKWIGQNDPNPLVGRIAAVRKGMKGYELEISTQAGLRKMSLYGDNQNFLVTKLGQDETKWTGTPITVTTEEMPGGKRRRVVS